MFAALIDFIYPTINTTTNSADAPQSTEYVSAHTPRDFNDVRGYNVNKAFDALFHARVKSGAPTGFTRRAHKACTKLR